MTIENTTLQGERGWTLGVNPKAIERQEAQGQAQLVADSKLPTDGLSGLPTAWGIKVLNEAPNDPLFTNVTLPTGWMLRATEHSMWSELVDATGTVKAQIFYKAAYYDRRAFVRAKRDDE